MVRLDELLAEAAEEGIFSGAVLRIDDLARGRVLREWVVGEVSREPLGGSVEASTLFDLASLTKLFTATAALRLAARGYLPLDSMVGDVAPSLRGARTSRATVRQLLDHRSGAIAWNPLFETASGSTEIRAAAEALPLESEPGGREVYSDIGFLVLQTLLEDRTRTPLEVLIEEEVLDPVGRISDLPGAGYRAVGAGEDAAKALVVAGGVAATEVCPRRGLVCGEVHDDNAWAMGGVAAHAGLFGAAASVAALARAWWQAPRTGFLPRDLRDAAWSVPKGEGTHVLGWDTVSPGKSSAGASLSPRSVGHLGFTGTSLWIDPGRATSIVLLTNRVHPSRKDDRIRALRPRIHDAAAAFIDAR
jgi:CubicO group peptidase (beta-lactamase class C family)